MTSNSDHKQWSAIVTRKEWSVTMTSVQKQYQRSWPERVTRTRDQQLWLSSVPTRHSIQGRCTAIATRKSDLSKWPTTVTRYSAHQTQCSETVSRNSDLKEWQATVTRLSANKKSDHAQIVTSISDHQTQYPDGDQHSAYKQWPETVQRNRDQRKILSKITDQKENLSKHIYPTLSRKTAVQNHLPEAVPRKTAAQNHLPKTVPRKKAVQNHLPEAVPRKTAAQNHLPKIVPRKKAAQNHLPEAVPRKTAVQNQCPERKAVQK